MASATLSRAGTSIEIPLLSDDSGTPLVVRGVGKPNQQIETTGAIHPRSIDTWSGLEQYTLTGKFVGDDAYTKSINLLDLMKTKSTGDSLILNIDMPDYDSNIKVAPAAGQGSACTCVYSPGWRDYVEVDLSLTRISKTKINSTVQKATTPLAAGGGPIQISDGSTTVDLTSDIEVSRSVGRPKSVIRKTSIAKYPTFEDKAKSAVDTFELNFQFSDQTVSKTNQLVDIFSKRLGYNSLNLDFNGLYGMGSFNVVPSGSEALRHSRQAGYKSSGLIPSVKLRRVLGV